MNAVKNLEGNSTLTTAVNKQKVIETLGIGPALAFDNRTDTSIANPNLMGRDSLFTNILSISMINLIMISRINVDASDLSPTLSKEQIQNGGSINAMYLEFQ